MSRVYLIVSGDVVGVGYRSWVKRRAQELGLTGWVKNREDNAVEILAEGTEASLTAFIAVCKKGPDVAWVKTVEVIKQKARNEFIDFSVLY